jgi:hypothetical protein
LFLDTPACFYVIFTPLPTPSPLRGREGVGVTVDEGVSGWKLKKKFMREEI